MSSQATRQIRSIVGDNIKVARDELELTQHGLAALLGMASGHTAVSRWERGVVMPATSTLTRIADVLGRDIHWFYTDHDREAA